MRILFFALVALTCSAALPAAGQCNDDTLMAITGKWTKSTAYNADKAKSPEATKRMDKMMQLLQSAYTPQGTEGKYWFSEGKDVSLGVNGPQTYELTADFMEYYCDTFQHKIKAGNETGDWFFIWANAFGRFAVEDPDFKIGNKQMYQLTPLIGKLGDFLLFAGADGNELQGRKQFSRTLLIARPGQLPYTPVSRKQFLVAFLQYREEIYQKDIGYELQRPVRTEAEEEIVKEKGYDNAGAYAADEKGKALAKSRYLQDYVSDKQSQEDALKVWELNYLKDIRPAKAFLAEQTEYELSKPAILGSGYHKSDFKNFLTENKGRMLVVVNDSYFSPKLPAYEPRFLVVYWMWGGNTPGLNYGSQVEHNLDFKALQLLLDK